MALRQRLTTGFLTAVAIILISCICSAEESPARLITIPEGIRIVLKDSRLVKISLAENGLAVADSLMSRSALLPQLSLSFEQSFLRYQPAVKFNDLKLPSAQRESFSYGILVYQTLFDFGKALSGYRAKKELANAQKASTESVKKLAALEFVTAYFDLLEAQKLIKVAEKEVESLTSYLNDAKAMYEQGAAVKNDLLPAQVKLADAKQKFIAARNYRDSLAAKLNNILALPIREKIAVQDIVMEMPSLPDIQEAWISAQEQRPEMVVIADRLKASEFSIKSKKVGNLPSFFAQGGYSYAENKFQVHPDNFNFNLGANMEFFDGGLTQAQVYKERALQRGLKEQEIKLIEDIKLEIENSYLGLKDAKEKVTVAKDVLLEAAENVRVNRAKYSEGAATSTDVLEAIALETSAQTNYYTAEYELKRNYSKLMYSMGIDLALIYDTMGLKDEPKK